MTDPNVIKENVRRLVAAGAPEKDIDDYIEGEKAKANGQFSDVSGGSSTDNGVRPLSLGQKIDKFGQGATSAALQGATFDFGDEAGGALKAALSPSSYTEGKFADNYRAGRDAIRQVDTDFGNAHPTIQKQLNIAGSLVPILATGGAAEAGEGAGLAIRAGRAAFQGAKYGAISGAGASKNGAVDTIMGALKGGSLGGALGVGLTGVGAAGGSLARSLGVPEAASAGAEWLSQRVPGKAGDFLSTAANNLGSKGAASAEISSRIRNDNLTPRQIAQTAVLRSRMSGEKPEMLADLSPELGKLTKTITKEPGAGRAAILSSTSDRASTARERIAADIGGGKVPEAAKPDFIHLVKEREESASKLFPEAYKAGEAGIDAPGLTELLSRPTFSKALKMARTMAADDGVQLPSKTETVFAPKIQAMIDQANPADRAAMIDKFSKIPGASEQKEIPLPDVRTVHYVDRAIRRMADDAYQGKGQIVDAGHADVLMKALAKERDIMAQQVPQFGRALQDYADRSHSIEAMKTGIDILKYIPGVKVPGLALGKGDPQALAAARSGIDGLEAAVHNMTEGERKLFRKGAQAAVVDAVNKVPATGTGSTTPILRRIFSDSPEGKRWQRLMFSDPDEAGAFQNALSRERGMAATNGRLSGSDTAENLGEKAALQNPAGLISYITHPVKALRGGLSAGADAATKRKYAALGERLAVTGSRDVANVMTDQEKEEAMRAMVRAASNLGRNAIVSGLTR